jgi:hypothetical protein
MQKRKRGTHTATFEERLAEEAQRFREAADKETGTAVSYCSSARDKPRRPRI